MSSAPARKRLADPQVVGALREYLDDRPAGMVYAVPLSKLPELLRAWCCLTSAPHTRRVTEAVSFLQAEGYPVGSIAGIGIFRIKDEEERQRAIRPEVHRLASIARKLEGLGYRKAARDLRQMALDLGGVAP